MATNSLIPRLASLLKRAPFRATTLRLLYHLSIDDRYKSYFTYTDAIPLVMQLVINFPQPKLPKELVALAINLSLCGRNAEQMTKGRCLQLLVDRLHKTKGQSVNFSLFFFHFCIVLLYLYLYLKRH